jgi:hypothetical protein
MKRLASLVVLASFVGLGVAWAGEKGQWTGYITDTHCGKEGASKDHTADCVRQCMREGSKAQIWSEADDQALDLDDFKKVASLVGNRVTIKGTFDSATKTITIESVARASGGEKPSAKKS